MNINHPGSRRGISTKSIFYLTAGLCGISGILHLAKLVVYPINTAAMVAVVMTGLFGVAYLGIGYFLLHQRYPLLWAGLFVPLVGFLLTLIGMQPQSDLFTQAFLVLDVLVMLLSAYLLISGRVVLRRVKGR